MSSLQKPSPPQAPLSVAITYNLSTDWDRVDVNSVVDGVTAIQGSLVELGHKATLLRVSEGLLPLIRTLETTRPDLIFNLVEGFHEVSAGESYVAGVFELLGIPYTGSAPVALSLSLDKVLAKQLFKANGIPTPDDAVYGPGLSLEPRLPYPVILKLAGEDASIGITGDNVVYDDEGFRRKLSELLTEHKAPVLAEQFIDGREFTVALLDGEPLVLEEIEFRYEPKVLCYQAKWATGSLQDEGSIPVFNPSVAPGQREEMFDIARRVWKLIGVRDYGRVDFRMDQAGRIYVLEVNPNPDITPNSGYRGSLEAAGMPFHEFVGRLIECAMRRK